MWVEWMKGWYPLDCYDFTRTIAVLKKGAFRHKGRKCFDPLKVNKNTVSKFVPNYQGKRLCPTRDAQIEGALLMKGFAWYYIFWLLFCHIYCYVYCECDWPLHYCDDMLTAPFLHRQGTSPQYQLLSISPYQLVRHQASSPCIFFNMICIIFINMTLIVLNITSIQLCH